MSDIYEFKFRRQKSKARTRTGLHIYGDGVPLEALL